MNMKMIKESKVMIQRVVQNLDQIQIQVLNHQDPNILTKNIDHQDIEKKVKVKEKLKNVII